MNWRDCKNRFRGTQRNDCSGANFYDLPQAEHTSSGCGRRLQGAGLWWEASLQTRSRGVIFQNAALLGVLPVISLQGHLRKEGAGHFMICLSNDNYPLILLSSWFAESWHLHSFRLEESHCAIAVQPCWGIICPDPPYCFSNFISK